MPLRLRIPTEGAQLVGHHRIFFRLGRRRVDLQQSADNGRILRRRLNGLALRNGCAVSLHGLCRLLRHVLDNRGVVRGPTRCRMRRCLRLEPAPCSATGCVASALDVLVSIDAVSVEATGSDARSSPAPNRRLSSSARMRTAAASRPACSARRYRLLGRIECRLRRRRRDVARRLHSGSLVGIAEMGAPGVLQIGQARAVQENRHRECPSLARGRGALLIDFHSGGPRDEARGHQHAEQAGTSVCIHTIYPPTAAAGYKAARRLAVD